MVEPAKQPLWAHLGTRSAAQGPYGQQYRESALAQRPVTAGVLALIPWKQKVHHPTATQLPPNCHPMPPRPLNPTAAILKLRPLGIRTHHCSGVGGSCWPGGAPHCCPHAPGHAPRHRLTGLQSWPGVNRRSGIRAWMAGSLMAGMTRDRGMDGRMTWTRTQMELWQALRNVADSVAVAATDQEPPLTLMKPC